MKNNYKHFQDRIRTENKADGLTNNQFVFSAENSTTLQEVDNADNKVMASVVNLQEKDIAYIYTQGEDQLKVGQIWTIAYHQQNYEWDVDDYWNRFNIYWMIVEEIIVIKEVLWHKYLAFKCNVTIDGLHGYWIGPEKHFVDVKLQEKTILQSQQHPVLILPSASNYAIGSKILVKDRAWLIQEADNISTEGVTYYSLRATTISKNEITDDVHVVENQSQVPDAPIGEVLENGDNVLVSAGAIITVDTENGYFRTTNPLIQVTNINATKVTFVVPYGVDGFKIDVKQSGEIVSTQYKVVVSEVNN